MSVDTKWFRDRLADRQLSQRGLARLMGLDAAAVSLMFRGKREMKITEAAELARLLGVPADDVLEAAGVRIASQGERIPIVGWVDGAAEFHWQNDGDTLPHPGAGLAVDITAAQCRTAGSPLAHMDGWILYGQGTAPNGVQAESVGRLSWCRLRGGVIYLAAPSRSRQRGRWDLAGPAVDVRAADLEWAAPVLLIQP
jgi:transcriptional regulator with XRE-family HTH domain